MAKTKFRPLHDRVVVRRIDAEEKTKGGIIIPDTAKEKPQQGEVVAVGNGKVKDDGTRIAQYLWGDPVAMPYILFTHGWSSHGARLLAWIEPLLRLSRMAAQFAPLVTLGALFMVLSGVFSPEEVAERMRGVATQGKVELIYIWLGDRPRHARGARRPEAGSTASPMVGSPHAPKSKSLSPNSSHHRQS